jgi:serine/threonine-protein kinase
MCEPGLERERSLAALRAEQVERWQRGERAPAEDYLAREGLAGDGEAALDLIYNEIVVREELGEAPRLEEYLRRFPQYDAPLRRQFAVHRALASEQGETVPAAPQGELPAGAETPAITGYEVLGELGRGGMGVVYKARHLKLNRLVALKVLWAGGGARDEELARFRTEAEAAARLQHPNVVQVHEVGEQGGVPFVALEHVEGGSLAQKINGTPLPARQAAELLQALARAMHEAHRHRIVHRDLKPANVLLTADGTPKVTDFGLAKCLDGAGQTRTGAILGTPSYAAPEQVEGRAGAVTPSADVYGLGAILYEMLTGRPPFKAETALDTVRQVVGEDPVPPGRLNSKVPRDLETICLKCLRKEPKKRYASGADLAEDLGRFLRGEPTRARPAPRWERGLKWARRRPAAAALLGVSGLAAATLLGVWVAFAARLQAETTRALEQQALAEGQRLQAEGQRARAERERDEARRQSDRAEEILRIALRGVEEHALVTRSGRQEELAHANPGGVLFRLACSYARTSTAFEHNTKLTPQDRAELAQQYAALAMKLLDCASGIGYFKRPDNLRDLKTHEDLGPLRQRADFRALLARLR